jgi:hypothetical protein
MLEKPKIRQYVGVPFDKHEAGVFSCPHVPVKEIWQTPRMFNQESKKDGLR